MRLLLATGFLAVSGCASLLSLDEGHPLDDASAPPGVVDVAAPVDSPSADSATGGQDAGCSAGMKSCGPGACASTADPSAGCGAPKCAACSAPNATSFTCAGPDCAVASCATNFRDCNKRADDGCEVDITTASNCTQCGLVCDAAVPNCGPSGCTLDCAPLEKCGTSCVDTRSNPSHCGSCPNQCPSDHANPICNDGGCALQCNSGYQDCDGKLSNGCEADLNNDPVHCGTCTTSCLAALPVNTTSLCVAASCTAPTCVSGWWDCDGLPGCEHFGPCPPDAGPDVGVPDVGVPDTTALDVATFGG
jgi:hypothetical protein